MAGPAHAERSFPQTERDREPVSKRVDAPSVLTFKDSPPPGFFLTPNGELVKKRDYSYDAFASHPAIMGVDRSLADMIPEGPGLVVDNGCGTGAMTGHLLDAGKLTPPYQIVGVDIDPEAVKQADEKYGLPSVAAEYGMHIAFVVGDSQALPLKDKSARGVIEGNNIHMIPNVKQAYQEDFRVLENGGILEISTAYANGIAIPEGPEAPFWGSLVTFGKQELKSMGYEGPVGKPENLYKYTKDDHQNMLEEVGFSDIQMKEVTVLMDAEAIEAICTYHGFAEGALSGVPVEIAVEALIRAIPKAFARTNRFRDGTEGKEKITKIPRGWLFIEAKKIIGEEQNLPLAA